MSKANNILTVSDLEGFIKNGGMIGFVESDGKIKFEISVRRASLYSFSCCFHYGKMKLKMLPPNMRKKSYPSRSKGLGC